MTTRKQDQLPPISEEHHILRRTLGLDNSKKEYRNYYCAVKGSSSHDICVELERKGFMEKEPGSGDLVFRCTEMGKVVAKNYDVVTAFLNHRNGELLEHKSRISEHENRSGVIHRLHNARARMLREMDSLYVKYGKEYPYIDHFKDELRNIDDVLMAEVKEAGSSELPLPWETYHLLSEKDDRDEYSRRTP